MLFCRSLPPAVPAVGSMLLTSVKQDENIDSSHLNVMNVTFCNIFNTNVTNYVDIWQLLEYTNFQRKWKPQEYIVLREEV